MVLMCKRNNTFQAEPYNQIIVPRSLQQKVLRISHLSHFGLKKHMNLLQENTFGKMPLILLPHVLNVYKQNIIIFLQLLFSLPLDLLHLIR